MRLMLCWLLAWFSLAGCHKRQADAWGDSYEEEASRSGYGIGGGVSAKRAMAAPSIEPPPAPMMAEAASMAEPEPSEPATEPTGAAARMVHYNGYARLRVARIDEGVDAVKAVAEAAGGFVERIGGDSITVRVPVKGFKEAFAEVLALGEVLDKSITAEDVTEAFTSLDLRLKTAKTTRDRLVELLAKAKDEKEKLALLREIQRLSEDIDSMESQLRTLASLASYSRLSISLVAREALATQGPEDDPAELAWIRSLSPFRTDLVVESKRLKLDVPEGMVGLDIKKRFVAESADGARIWTHRIENQPQGDAEFWRSAVSERVGRDFATAEAVELGAFTGLRLVDRSDEPYTWLVGLRVSGDWLQLVQVYFPSAEQEKRYADAVAVVLAGGAS